MKGRLGAALVLAVLLVSRKGEELENVALIQTLGVDGREPAAVTAVEGEKESPVYRALGRDILEAQEALESAGDRRLELTHVARIVVGREADLEALLYRETVYRKSGCQAAVWLAEGRAEEILSGTEDPSARLRSLEKNGGAEAPTLLEALEALKEKGFVTLPVVGVRDGTLEMIGYESWKEGQDGR